MGRSQTGRPEGPHRLIPIRCRIGISSGITGTFAKAPCGAPLSLSLRYVTHALLTRSPLTMIQLPSSWPVRLACLSHAASVRSEPGSNSSVYYRRIRQIQKRLLNRLKFACLLRWNYITRRLLHMLTRNPLEGVPSGSYTPSHPGLIGYQAE